MLRNQGNLRNNDSRRLLAGKKILPKYHTSKPSLGVFNSIDVMPNTLTQIEMKQSSIFGDGDQNDQVKI